MFACFTACHPGGTPLADAKLVWLMRCWGAHDGQRRILEPVLGTERALAFPRRPSVPPFNVWSRPPSMPHLPPRTGLFLPSFHIPSRLFIPSVPVVPVPFRPLARCSLPTPTAGHHDLVVAESTIGRLSRPRPDTAAVLGSPRCDCVGSVAMALSSPSGGGGHVLSVHGHGPGQVSSPARCAHECGGGRCQAGSQCGDRPDRRVGWR